MKLKKTQTTDNTSRARKFSTHPAEESQRGFMDKGDDLQLRYRVFKSLCVPHKKKIHTPSLFCADFVFTQSFVGRLISEAAIIK